MPEGVCLGRGLFVFGVRNGAGENGPGDIQPIHFVYTRMGTRMSTYVSPRVGAFAWDYNTGKANFCGHSRVHSTCRSPFVGGLVGHISLSPALCFTEFLFSKQREPRDDNLKATPSSCLVTVILRSMSSMCPSYSCVQMGLAVSVACVGALDEFVTVLPRLHTAGPLQMLGMKPTGATTEITETMRLNFRKQQTHDQNNLLLAP